MENVMVLSLFVALCAEIFILTLLNINLQFHLLFFVHLALPIVFTTGNFAPDTMPHTLPAHSDIPSPPADSAPRG